jgi:hypothetical protein
MDRIKDESVWLGSPAFADELIDRWSYISDQFAALLRWIRVSCQAANFIGSVLLA